ncbi:MAG TPA: diguanylate cyclase, partial [Casimicrobiaceae bacterium]|nr:diguanylate cyclase [Casimicrobiaceae bacterium]
MSPPDRPPAAVPGASTPRTVALAYLALASLWILFSDGAMDQLIADRGDLLVAGAAKGWAFVGVTALLLYLSLRGQHRRLAAFVASAREIDERYRAMFEASPRPILVYDEHTLRVLAVNDAACRAYGYARDEFLQRTVDDLRPSGVDEPFAPASSSDAEGRRRRHLRKDGTPFIAEVDGAPIEIGGKPARIGFVQDVTDRVRDEEHIRASALAFENVGEAVAVLDPHGRFVSLNRSFARLTRFDEKDVLGKSAGFLIHGSPRLLRQSLASTGKVDGEVWLKRRDDKPFLVELSVRAVNDAHGAITHLVAVARDMSAEKAAEARIHALAYYDSLTGLPNRNLLEDRARQMVALHERNGESFALLMVDLDHFKQVNDTLGHVTGDLLLQTAARQIDAAVREADTAARWGGDEFVLLLPGTDQDAASRIAQRLQKAMAAPVTLDGRLVALGVSAGIALFPRDGLDFETLLKRAGSAMQRAKDLGRNTFQFYHEPLQGDARERVAIAGALRHALEGGQQMQVHYQPQLELGTGHVVGFEALMRWRHPMLGDVP